MRHSSAAPVAIVLLALTAALAGPSARGDHGPSEKFDDEVESWDGHKVPVTVYRPLVADADHRVPVLLHSHGWSGSRATADDAFHDFVAAGFGVVSIDMRGHGDARLTSEARVHHVDYEIRDVSAVIDYVAALSWAQLDRPGDPRLGALGGSYGGGYQLLAAARDGRLDAMAPQITWNDLSQSLAPNGVIRSAWIDLLYGAGNAFARVHPDIHLGFALGATTNGLPDGSLPGEPDIVGQFAQSSPASYPGRIAIPTILIQGMPDTLFNFNEAAANYAQIRAAGAPVKLVTHLGGHILNTSGTIPVPSPVDLGLQPGEGPSPCGSATDQTVQWFRRHLLADPEARTQPGVCLALDDGTKVEGNRFPLPGTADLAAEVTDPITLVPGVPGVTAERTVVTVEDETVLAGIPRLEGTVQTLHPDAIVFWWLKAHDAATGQDRLVDAQVTPQRIGGLASKQGFDLDLAGVGTRLRPGDTLSLVVSTSSEQFLHNGARLPGVVTFDGLTLHLPTL